LFISFVSASSTLYGIVEGPDQGAYMFVTVDPFTAMYYDKGLGSTRCYPGSLSALDTKNSIYYCIDYSGYSKLVGRSLTSERKYIEINLVQSNSPGVYVEFLLIDPKTSYLYYMVSQDPKLPEIHRFDADANETYLIGSLDRKFGHRPIFGLDSTNDLIFLQNTFRDPIYFYKLSTGALVKTIQDQFLTRTFNWDAKTGLMFGFAGDADSAGKYSTYLVSVNSTSGVIRRVAKFAQYMILVQLPSAASQAALDPESRSLTAYFSNQEDGVRFYIVSVNIDTGKVDHGELACPDRQCNLPFAYHYSNGN